MDTIFMDSENSKTSDYHWLLPNLLHKINLKRSDKCVALSNLSIWKTQIIFFKFQLRRGIKNLDCLVDDILYPKFMIVLCILLKSIKNLLIILVRIYVNKNICK